MVTRTSIQNIWENGENIILLFCVYYRIKQKLMKKQLKLSTQIEFKVNEYITVNLLTKNINEKLKIEIKDPVIFVDEKPSEC